MYVSRKVTEPRRQTKDICQELSCAQVRSDVLLCLNEFKSHVDFIVPTQPPIQLVPVEEFFPLG
jgi:hypothetical protein